MTKTIPTHRAALALAALLAAVVASPAPAQAAGWMDAIKRFFSGEGPAGEIADAYDVTATVTFQPSDFTQDPQWARFAPGVVAGEPYTTTFRCDLREHEQRLCIGPTVVFGGETKYNYKKQPYTTTESSYFVRIEGFARAPDTYQLTVPLSSGAGMGGGWKLKQISLPAKHADLVAGVSIPFLIYGNGLRNLKETKPGGTVTLKMVPVGTAK